VIGGTGFISSFVVRALLDEGRNVVVVGRNEHPTRPLPAGVVYIPGDFGDKYFLRGVLRGVDEIIDLAYATVPKSSYDNPVQDIFDNLPRPSLVQAFMAADLFVFASNVEYSPLVLFESAASCSMIPFTSHMNRHTTLVPSGQSRMC
jgi:Nucleoside-diphosphate-sugar epimerases